MCCKRGIRWFKYLLPLIIYIVIAIIAGCLLYCNCFDGNKRVELTIQYAVVAATFGASLIALFKDRYDRWCYKPNLKLSFEKNKPIQFAKTKLKRDESEDSPIVEGYSLRLKVCNEGLGWAEDVMVRIQSLNEYHLAPVNLVWTNRQSKKLDIKQRTTQERLYLDLDYYCDLAEIYSDKYQLCTEVNPFNESNCFKIGPTEECFKLTIYAKNFMPKSYTLKITYKQYYPHDAYSEMVSKGVKVSLKEM